MAATLAQLMDVLGFQQGDLDANRRGVLSERQRAMYTPSLAQDWLQVGCSAVSSIGCLTLFPALLAAPAWGGYTQNGSVLALLLAMLFTGMAVLGFGLGAFGAYAEAQGTREGNAAMRQDVHENTVKSGWMTVTTDEAGEHTYLTNDGVRLYVDDTDGVVQVGDEYIVYYLPHSNLLIAAEPLPQWAR